MLAENQGVYRVRSNLGRFYGETQGCNRNIKDWGKSNRQMRRRLESELCVGAHYVFS